MLGNIRRSVQLIFGEGIKLQYIHAVQLFHFHVILSCMLCLFEHCNFDDFVAAKYKQHVYCCLMTSVVHIINRLRQYLKQYRASSFIVASLTASLVYLLSSGIILSFFLWWLEQ